MAKILRLFFVNKVLIVILIVAALLRFIGTNPGYNQYHSDQGISYSAASSMVKNGNFDPLRYDYPALVPWINYFFFQLIFIPFYWLKYFLTHILEILDGLIHIPIAPLEAKRLLQVYILGERDIHTLFWSRYVTALFSLGNVVLIYILAKKVFKDFGKKAEVVGLLSAVILTFNYKHVANSHIGLPDIYNSFFLLLSLIATFRVIEYPNFRNYLLATLAVGLSFSTKYQLLAPIAFLAGHLLTSFDGKRLNIRKLFSINFLISLIVPPALFILLNPYFFIHLEQALKMVRDVSSKYQMGNNKLNLYPIWYLYHIDMGLPQLLLVLVGLFLALKKVFKQSLVLFSVLLPFAFIFLYYSNGGFYVRNFITITPVLIIFAAFSLFQIHELLAGKVGVGVSTLIIVLLVGAVVFIPGRNAVINSYYYTKPWGYDVLRDYWSKTDIPSDTIIAAHPFEYTRGAIRNKRTEFELDGAYSLSEHKENSASYALMNLDWAGNPFYFWMGFGLEDLPNHWKKPYNLMRNTYHGVAAEELFRYQIFSTTKPWQAPESALILAKIPQWPEALLRRIKQFNFDTGVDGWRVYNSEDLTEFQYDEQTGQLKNGSLVHLVGSGLGRSSRMSSPPVEVKIGHLYRVAGSIKTKDLLTSRQRDGFLRIDFYKDSKDIGNLGKNAVVSSRVYGNSDWTVKEILERAPDEAKFMSVSFGIYRPAMSTIWLDDVTVEESVEMVEDITKKQPYNIKDIELDLLYPNSHGNL